MKENEREEVLKHLGLAPDASPQAIGDQIAQLRQKYEVLARVPAKQTEAEAWLRFLAQAEPVLLSQPAEGLCEKTDQESQRRENSSPAAEEKDKIESNSGELQAAVPDIKQEQMLANPQNQPSSESSLYASHQEVPPQLPPVELFRTPRYVWWWLSPGLMIGLLLAPLIFHLKSIAVEAPSGGPSNKQIAHAASFLRLALYDPSSVVVHYSVASDPNLHIELKRELDIAKLVPDGNAPVPFQLAVVPFTIAVQNSARFKAAGWELIWVCDESNTMDRIFLSKEIKESPEDVIRGDWLTIKNSRAAHQLDIYLDLVTKKKLKYKHENLKELDSPEEVLHSIDNNTEIVAIPYPWAESSQLAAFEDVTEFVFSQHKEHEVNVILARKELVNDAELRPLLIKLLSNLLDYPRRPDPNGLDAHVIFSNDPKLKDDLPFTELNIRSGRQYFILQQDYPVELQNNLEFLYDFGNFACSLIAEDQVRHIAWERKHQPSPCKDLIDKNGRNLLIDDLQRSWRERPQFTELERDQLCSSDDASQRTAVIWPFVYNSSDPRVRVSKYPSPAEKLNEFINANFQNAARSFCLVGHGDATGTLEDNDELGRKRAESVLRLLRNSNFSQTKFVVVSHSNRDPWDSTNQEKNRRVEIRRIQFDIQ